MDLLIQFLTNTGYYLVDFRNIIMLLVGSLFIYLAIAKEYEPLLLLPIGFGILIELCQRAVGYRSAEWLDIGADVVGVVVGLLIGLAGAGGWSQRFEEWYLARGADAGLD